MKKKIIVYLEIDERIVTIDDIIRGFDLTLQNTSGIKAYVIKDNKEDVH
ncbi:hypothetical protein JDFR1000234_40 [uncultured archaeal virus]|jgi:hypothetical protein|uniref:Uncharacterized protein n=1 Tax=uncultured archaeal virus TaxID=1960247 RepID=A0A1S5Y318_9VIRU|nr:hypothetical protein JDFR1000234_40 [uncultured archaeal virus]